MKRRTLLATSIAMAAGRPVYAESTMPRPIATNLVATSGRDWNGRDCLAVELTDDEQKLRLQTTGGGNRPSMALVHPDFTNGTIEATIGGELTGKGAPDDR